MTTSSDAPAPPPAQGTAPGNTHRAIFSDPEPARAVPAWHPDVAGNVSRAPEFSNPT